ncbi:predicted protein [Chaetomium globosum CBS 148.51]|uniref:Uncharacterized protein n=1 Tax=Chaetomium globosum (strain ATCC 6205 / CBS 148.51 / DSM 1962 / NBRC 6347 / NRRL 1970) TaxID=306901 RepID=Q2HA77_CHAGB|nr:uncharacterized protein CHGG_02877 [Chaetomium globosum CBS 148.51]EAQ90942.1 predicted protein [Chaetomium globosum CBS 148.51]
MTQPGLPSIHKHDFTRDGFEHCATGDVLGPPRLAYRQRTRPTHIRRRRFTHLVVLGSNESSLRSCPYFAKYGSGGSHESGRSPKSGAKRQKPGEARDDNDRVTEEEMINAV